MRFFILFIPLLILSIWVWAIVYSIYGDIFIYHNLIDGEFTINWFHSFVFLFLTGIPLWIITVYFIFKKLPHYFNISYIELFYIFMGYLTFIIILIGHQIRPIVWETILLTIIIHIWFLILIVISSHQVKQDKKNDMCKK